MKAKGLWVAGVLTLVLATARFGSALENVRHLALTKTEPMADSTVTVAPTEKPATVSEVLTSAAARVGLRPDIEVLRADADGVDFRVTVSVQTPGSGRELQLAVLEALQEAKIRLGRGRSPA